MIRYRHYCLLLIGTLLLGSCQSVEQLSIDYMLPAEVSFPTILKRVAVVNNMPDIPDNKLIVNGKKKKKGENEVARLTNYYNGDGTITTEALAEALADENYFEEVVICDSALRSKDINPRESTLSQEEVQELVRDLDVDFLIALENVQMRSCRKISYAPDWGVFFGTVDVKVYPTVKIYLPNRKGPMLTVNSNDSIFWEEAERTEALVRSRLISEEEMVKQASGFAGTVPVKHLLPYWKTGHRYLFSGGSVNMRDAAVYAREENWSEAIELWKQTYNAQKGKQKMYAAYNTALGYEMQDSISTALEWALKAQALAREKSKTDKKKNGEIQEGTLSYYILTSMYVDELEKRKEGMTRLNIQMDRFEDDF
ncbi:MAG: tetratricopeptide repeat protein [Bacteroides sp.]|nr:tetratricopeptide repeat protein [Bacteroides sp.]